MSKNYLEIPDGYSIDLPSHDLVLNVSPFPSFKCLEIVNDSNKITPNGEDIWIKISSKTFCRYKKDSLFAAMCPLCGRPFHEEDSNA